MECGGKEINNCGFCLNVLIIKNKTLEKYRCYKTRMIII